ncbi:hypothetical protein ACFZB9_16920 [Kitasatospora sp. NPDC008050]|uniref:hypothetical protein n=1 Tax=Kitasatospora sp. NPDC008050 TaxID=3364021 RepID=UPI0036EB5C2B
MLRFEVGTEDLLHSRFALSPAFELCTLLGLLGSVPGRRPPTGWVARLRPAFERLRARTELDAVLTLQTPSFGANFIALPPTGLAQSWADDLTAIRRAPPAAARADIARCLAAQPAAAPAVRAGSPRSGRSGRKQRPRHWPSCSAAPGPVCSPRSTSRPAPPSSRAAWP